MKHRILMVDDEDDVRRLAGIFLRDAGFDVLEAANGVQVMPEKEGAETVQALRRLRSDLPVLAISGVVGADFYLHAAKMLGASATLRKPFTREQLIGAIEPLLGIQSA
jgi:CheY-like chemotaxis protein